MDANAAFQVNSGWLVGVALAAAFVILYPIVLAIIAHRRLGVGWRYFWFGILIFFLFQIISRLPLVTVAQAFLAPYLKASPLFSTAWLVLLALTAGLFEEVGRYVGYRWLMGREQKTWSKGVMYGIGHGGLESMLLIGGQLIITLVNWIILMNTGGAILPAAQKAAVAQQIASLNSLPVWLSVAGAWERLWTLPLQIALALVVLQVFTRNSLRWLWLAILIHTLVDLTVVLLQRWLGLGVSASLIIEGFIMLVGLAALWLIWRLRDREVAPGDHDFAGDLPQGVGGSA